MQRSGLGSVWAVRLANWRGRVDDDGSVSVVYDEDGWDARVGRVTAALTAAGFAVRAATVGTDPAAESAVAAGPVDVRFDPGRVRVAVWMLEQVDDRARLERVLSSADGGVFWVVGGVGSVVGAW